MSAIVKSRIVKIGNSHGLRIPKLLMQEAGLVGEVEMEVRAGQLVVRAAHSIREGWEEAFASMGAAGDDLLLDSSEMVLNNWEQTDWQW